MSDTPANVEAALQARAVLATNKEAAQAVGVPESTLQNWIYNKHRDRYQQIRREVAPKIQAAIAAETEDLVLEMVQVRRQALGKLRDDIGNLHAKDAAAAVKNLAIAESNGIDKALLLRGQPTAIVERRDPEELIRKLSAIGVIDVDHEPITEQQDASPEAAAG